MEKILFFGELPPNSIHGVALSNQINLHLLDNRFKVFTVIETSILSQHSKLTFFKVRHNIKNVLKLCEYLFKYRFTYFYIVYSNSFWGGIKTALFLSIVRIINPQCKTVVHVHRGDLLLFIKKSFKNLFAFKLVEIFSNKFIFLSLFDVDVLSHFIPKYKICELKNCINRNAVFLQKNNHKIKFIYLSNYIIEKGILDLLNVFLQHDNAELVCYGDFSDEKLEKEIKIFEQDNIKIYGPVTGEDKFDKLSLSDCLILPSRNEGMPLVLLEAMSTGTPFICSNVGFIQWNIYEDYPLIYNLHEPNGLSNKINYFLSLSVNEKNLISNKLVDYYNLNFSSSSHEDQLNKIFI